MCCKATHLTQKSMIVVLKLATFVGMTCATKHTIPTASLFHRHIQVLINRMVAQAEQREVNYSTKEW